MPSVTELFEEAVRTSDQDTGADPIIRFFDAFHECHKVNPELAWKLSDKYLPQMGESDQALITAVLEMWKENPDLDVARYVAELKP
jgi:hypothetical protein